MDIQKKSRTVFTIPSAKVRLFFEICKYFCGFLILHKMHIVSNLSDLSYGNFSLTCSPNPRRGAFLLQLWMIYARC